MTQRDVEQLVANTHPVRARARGRSGAEIWPEPTPLVRPLAPAPEYPLAALGPILGPAAGAIIDIVQVPPALAANSVLAAAALPAQTQADVQTLGGRRPLSLFVLTVASSGDRKSSADAIALQPVRDRIRELAAQYSHDAAEWEAQSAAVKIQRADARKALADRLADQRKRKTSTQTDAFSQPGKASVQDTPGLEAIEEPTPPRKPWMICTEPTPEGLLLSLRDGQLGQGIYTDEGGTFLGGHGMSEDSELRTIAMLSRAWQGDSLDRVRARDAEHITLYGRRVSIHLMAQPEVAARLLSRPLFRAQGFLARWLIAAPASIAGSRRHDPRAPLPGEDPRLRRYSQAMTELLCRPPLEDRELGGIAPPCLQLTPEARGLLIAAYNQFEVAQAAGGALENSREWASKAAEHACRIAGVLALAGDPEAMFIPDDVMHSALRLVEHYVAEYGRLVGTAGVSDEIERAEVLLQWIPRWAAHKEFNGSLSLRNVMQFGPGSIRAADVARAALATLADHGWLRVAGRGYSIHPFAQHGAQPRGAIP